MSLLSFEKRSAAPIYVAPNTCEVWLDTNGNIRYTNELLQSFTLSTGITSEEVQDIIGSILSDTPTINLIYNDLGNLISASVNQSGLDHTQFQNIGTNSHQQIDQHISSTNNPHSTTAIQVGADPSGTAQSIMNNHISAPDDHIQYLNQTRGDLRYSQIGHTHAVVTETVNGFMSATDKIKLNSMLAPQVKKTTTDLETTSNSIFTNITELQQNCVVGKAYRFEFYLLYKSGNNTNGIKPSIGGTAIGTIAAIVSAITNADGTGGMYSGPITSLGDAVTTTAVQSANTSYLCKIEGIFVCTTEGVIFPQFMSENSGIATTILAGSVGLVFEV